MKLDFGIREGKIVFITNEEVLQKVRSLGKVELGLYPTPLHRLDRLSRALGVNLWVKREDMSGVSLFGGNKIRKLQYLLWDAGRQGCDTVYTYGATQSNHAMQTAVAARRCGLRPVLYLGAIVEARPGDIRANLLLDRILGAEVHILPSEGRSTKETMAAFEPRIAAHRQRLLSEGHKVYDVPIGGSTPLGAAGFTEAFAETMKQAEAAGFSPDFLYTCTGSGGTLAGLAAGKALTGNPVQIRGVLSGKKAPKPYAEGLLELACGVLALLGGEHKTDAPFFTISSDFVGPGYEMPYKEANDDIRLLARTEGLFTDPVYSGKAFHGLMEDIRSGRVPQGSSVIFLLTGGATALFSEAEIVGDLATEP